MKTSSSDHTRGAAALACLVFLIVFAVPYAAAAGATFRPGLYVGKTSQGEAVRLKVVACGTKQCLETPGEEAYFSVDLSCRSGGQTEEEIIDFPKVAIAKSGAVHYVVGSTPGATSSPGSTVKVTVGRGGTLSGRIHLEETLETWTRCDSGEVTLTAKIGGKA